MPLCNTGTRKLPVNDRNREKSCEVKQVRLRKSRVECFLSYLEARAKQRKGGSEGGDGISERQGRWWSGRRRSRVRKEGKGEENGMNLINSCSIHI